MFLEVRTDINRKKKEKVVVIAEEHAMFDFHLWEETSVQHGRGGMTPGA